MSHISDKRRRLTGWKAPADVLVGMEIEEGYQRRAQEDAQAAEAAGTGAATPGPGSGPGREPTVIDLTEEPDSPRQQMLALPDMPRFLQNVSWPRPQEQRRNPYQRNESQNSNPRRQMPRLNRRTPTLARSDGSLLGNADGVPVIDLTDDSPNVPQPPQNGPAPQEPSQARRRNYVEIDDDHQDLPVWGYNLFSFRDQRRSFGALDFINRLRGGMFGREPPDVDVELIGPSPLFPNMDNPLINNPVNFNYEANGFNNRNAPRPKPAHEPPPPARPGFTRNTAEDNVVICPSCEGELKYSPTADADEADAPPAKRARTRKDREEHHFWAVKACGHVSEPDIPFVILSTDTDPLSLGLLQEVLREPQAEHQKSGQDGLPGRGEQQEGHLRRRGLRLRCHK